jgi:hypothetical protein
MHNGVRPGILGAAGRRAERRPPAAERRSGPVITALRRISHSGSVMASLDTVGHNEVTFTSVSPAREIPGAGTKSAAVTIVGAGKSGKAGTAVRGEFFVNAGLMGV